MSRKFPPACICPSPGCKVHNLQTKREIVPLKHDLVNFLDRLGPRTEIFLEDEAGNFHVALIELIESQGPKDPAFFVIKRAP